MNGGGRDGAHTFPVRGRRTGMEGARKLCGSAGMLLQYLIGPEMGQREVIDGGAARVLTGGDGEGWRGSSRGASTGWCGAVGEWCSGE
jgi:hypothetical protein